jgi:hypothetical protein
LLNIACYATLDVEVKILCQWLMLVAGLPAEACEGGLLVAGYWLLVAGYWLLVAGCWLLGYWKPILTSDFCNKKRCSFWLHLPYNSGVNRCELKEAIDGFPIMVFQIIFLIHRRLLILHIVSEEECNQTG